jgi:hypothetical protein
MTFPAAVTRERAIPASLSIARNVQAQTRPLSAGHSLADGNVAVLAFSKGMSVRADRYEQVVFAGGRHQHP